MLAVGELLLTHASKGNEGVVQEILAKFGWRSAVPVPAVPNTEGIEGIESHIPDSIEATDMNTADVNGNKAPLIFDEKIVIVNKAKDPVIQDLVDEKAYDLSDVDVMTPGVFQKHINLLF